MNVFLTKVWGFGEPAGPLQFPTKGWRQNALEQLGLGDLVLLVGTHGGETSPSNRGRALGLMEPTRQLVASLDFDLRQAPQDFDEDGRYKWPFGLHNIRAWALPDRPRLAEISDRVFSMDAVRGIVALNSLEVDRVLALQRREVPLLEPRPQTKARLRAEGGARRPGPPPSHTMRAGIMHMRNAEAFTYLMMIEGGKRPACKLGWAFDPKMRARHFNHASLPELGGVGYRLHLTQRWASAREAFRMEQTLLRHFVGRLDARNGEILIGPALDVERAWVSYVRLNL